MAKMPERRVPYVLDFMMWRMSLQTRGAWHPQLTTGATGMLYAPDWMADRILEEGLANRQERFRAVGERLKEGFGELGFASAAAPRHASPVMAEFLVPQGMSATKLRTRYMTRHNIMVGGGERKGEDGTSISFRVAHFGRAAEPERIGLLLAATAEFVRDRA